MEIVNDWTSKVAQHIYDELPRVRNRPRVERIAAIIATYAEPLTALLREAKRGHDRGYHEESCDYPPCPKSDDDASPDAVCSCTADAWNARVDAVLASHQDESGTVNGSQVRG